MFYTTTLGYNDAGRADHRRRSPLGYTTTTIVTTRPANRPRSPTRPDRFVRTSYDLAGRACLDGVRSGQSTSTPTRSPRPPTTWPGGQTSDVGLHRQRVRRMRHGADAPRSTAYDAAGRPTQTTSAEGRHQHATATTPPASWTSVTQRVDPAVRPRRPSPSALGYDRAGNRTRMVDGNGNATIYTYTTVGPARVGRSNRPPPRIPTPPTAPGPPSTTPAGQPIQQRLPGAVTRNRDLRQPGPADRRDRSGAGLTTTARTLDYDALGPPDQRLVAGRQPHVHLDRPRPADQRPPATAAGRPSPTTPRPSSPAGPTPPGRSTFTYDDAGRLATIVDPLTGQHRSPTATTPPAGCPRSATAPSNAEPRRSPTTTSAGFATDTVRRPEQHRVAHRPATPTTRTACSPARPPPGVTGAGANTYTYDGLGRVTTWLSPGGTTTTLRLRRRRPTAPRVTTPAGTRTSTFDATQPASPARPAAAGPTDSVHLERRAAR